MLLQRGAGVNSKDKDNITALMEASIMDHRDVVRHLLKVMLAPAARPVMLGRRGSTGGAVSSKGVSRVGGCSSPCYS